MDRDDRPSLGVNRDKIETTKPSAIAPTWIVISACFAPVRAQFHIYILNLDIILKSSFKSRTGVRPVPGLFDLYITRYLLSIL